MGFPFKRIGSSPTNAGPLDETETFNFRLGTSF